MHYKTKTTKRMNRAANYITQICTAAISLIASLTTVLMISFSTRKLSSPYRRLIFGMSIADIFQSLALVTGPFFIPAGTPRAIFASMNTASCEANAFFMVLGSTSVPLYMFALSLFYLCKLNFKFTDGDFARRIEKKFHIATISVMLILCTVGLALDFFNPSPAGSFCYVEEYPFGCSIAPESFGECTRGGMGSEKIFVLIIIIIICACFLGIAVNFTLLCVKSFYIERMFRSRAGDISNYADYYGRGDDHDCDDNICTCCNGKFKCCCSCSGSGISQCCNQCRGLCSGVCSCMRNFFTCAAFRNYHQLEHEPDADYVLRLYKRETIIQSSLYVGAFFLAYLLPMMQTIGSLFAYKFPNAIGSTMSFFYPLGGLANIFVYTRPKIVRFRHVYPNCSRIRAFFFVMRAGGELPDLCDPDLMHRVESCNWMSKCCCSYPSLWKRSGQGDGQGDDSTNENDTASRSLIAAQIRMLDSFTG